MPTFLDAVIVLLITTAYLAFVTSLNILASIKGILYLPSLVFLLLFIVYAIKAPNREPVRDGY